MSDETIIQLIRWGELLMQVSILVPMAVVWKRKKDFPTPIRMLSWYVYLSVGCVIAAKLAAFYFHNNLLLVSAFNGGKVLLFAAVYTQVLSSGRVRRVLLQATVVALLIIVSSIFYNWKIAGNIARMMQCTLLAGFALAYLEQELNNPALRRGFRDPIWLLSVGQLLYSGGSIVGNLDTFTDKPFNSWVLFSSLIFSGLIFNYFLTLVFLRAQQYDLATSPLTVSS